LHNRRTLEVLVQGFSESVECVVKIRLRSPLGWWPLIDGIDRVWIRDLRDGSIVFDKFHPMRTRSYPIDLAGGRYRVDVECTWSRSASATIEIDGRSSAVIVVSLAITPLGKPKIHAGPEPPWEAQGD
jgi:hypothetical protein